MKRYYVVDMSGYVVAAFNSGEKQIDFYTKHYQRGFNMVESGFKYKKGEFLTK